MGVSVQQGKGKGQLVELNLVPFIDFMSCMIAFLMISAVWVQLAAHEVDQSISEEYDGPISDEPAPPPLTVHVEADGTWVGRHVEEGVKVARVGEAQDLGRLTQLLAADRALYPRERMVVLNTDDGVPYGEMAAALDLTRAAGFESSLLAGGPPASALPTR